MNLMSTQEISTGKYPRPEIITCRLIKHRVGGIVARLGVFGVARVRIKDIIINLRILGSNPAKPSCPVGDEAFSR